MGLRVGCVVPPRDGAPDGTDIPTSPGTSEPTVATSGKVPRPEDNTERLMDRICTHDWGFLSIPLNLERYQNCA